jgi:hypothetical protein
MKTPSLFPFIASLSCMGSIFLLTACATTKEVSNVSAQLAPPQHVVDVGNEAPLIRYNRYLSGGAHTWESHTSGWQITHALAVLAGNSRAEAKILEQIRHSLIGENCISANGGYPAQHERHITGVYTILKGSDFWNEKLTDEERHQITLLMKAALIGSAYTTADASYESQISTLDGDRNLNRGWNPNFREGMFGGLIHATVFFGGVKPTMEILRAYDHEAFVAELAAAGLTNTHEIFTWKQNHPESVAPASEAIERSVKNYKYKGEPLKDPMQMLYELTTNTYGAEVNCGLNDGAGLLWKGVPTGTIASGCDELPNKGKPGMLLEFASRDAGGPRSSITYAYDGFRPNLTNHVVVLVGGYWEAGEQADEIVSLLDVGIPDLKHKLEHGYRNYAKAKGHTSVFSIENEKWKPSFATTLPLWFEVVRPYHLEAAE